jgi:hypothetical protein
MRKPNALPLAAAQLPGIAALEVPGTVFTQTYQLQHLGHAPVDLLARLSGQFECHSNVAADRHMRKQTSLLDDIADAPAQPNQVLRGNIAVAHHDAAASRQDKTVHGPQQCSLPGT